MGALQTTGLNRRPKSGDNKSLHPTLPTVGRVSFIVGQPLNATPVISCCDKMEDDAIIGFEFEIVDQARVALAAAEELWFLQAPYKMDRMVEEDKVAEWQAHHARTRLYQSAFANAAARISRIMWPPRHTARMPERGPMLRAIFDVAHDSPLRCRRLRNAMEHQDEHIEEYYRRPREERLILGPGFGQHLGGNLTDAKPATFRISHGTTECDVLEVYRELKRIVATWRGPTGVYVFRKWPQPLEEAYMPILAELSDTIDASGKAISHSGAAQHLVPADSKALPRGG